MAAATATATATATTAPAQEKFLIGESQEIGLMFVSVIYHALVNLPKLQPMKSAVMSLHIISKKVVMVKLS
jgi:hypothetical protein